VRQRGLLARGKTDDPRAGGLKGNTWEPGREVVKDGLPPSSPIDPILRKMSWERKRKTDRKKMESPVAWGK